MIPSMILGTFNRNGRYFRLEQVAVFSTKVLPKDFGYAAEELQETGGSVIITVPKGFITDFASVPQAVWSLVPPIGRIAFPAILHDYLYVWHPAGRKWADAVLLAAMKENGMNWLHRGIVWAAVRVFGRKPYDGDRAFAWTE